MHRVFVDLKAAITGNSRRAVVDEVARGESYAEAVFDKALRADLPMDVQQIVRRQHNSVRESREPRAPHAAGDELFRRRRHDAVDR
jgi:uncharacterized protein (TIGR02284 family)